MKEMDPGSINSLYMLIFMENKNSKCFIKFIISFSVFYT